LRGGGALSISDERGRVTGDSAGSINRSIPDSFFGMLGDLEYLIVPKAGTYHLSFVGADVGALLDEENLDDGTPTDTSTDGNHRPFYCRNGNGRDDRTRCTSSRPAS